MSSGCREGPVSTGLRVAVDNVGQRYSLEGGRDQRQRRKDVKVTLMDSVLIALDVYNDKSWVWY